MSLLPALLSHSIVIDMERLYFNMPDGEVVKSSMATQDIVVEVNKVLTKPKPILRQMHNCSFLYLLQGTLLHLPFSAASQALLRDRDRWQFQY
jgi:hypothetical protein